MRARLPDERQMGFDLQADGQAKVLGATEEEWQTLAWRFIENRARARQPFTADMLRDAVGAPSRPNALGATFTRAERAGLIRLDGYVPSIRASRRGGRVAIWVGT